MIKTMLLCTVLAAFSAAPAFGAAAAAAPSLDDAAARLLGRQVLRDMTSEKAKRTIWGAKALWIDLVVQKPAESAAFESLEADLKLTDMEGQLRKEGFKVMDSKKRSLAIGLRPTLVLMVLRSPKGAEGIDSGFYLVVANVVQDVTPLGGDTISMSTWVKAGQAIPMSGDDHKDIDAIRVSARAAVRSFIDAARDK